MTQRCPNCGSTLINCNGSRNGKPQWKCRICRKQFVPCSDPPQKGNSSIDTGCPEGGPSCINCTLPECVMDKGRKAEEHGHRAAVC